MDERAIAAYISAGSERRYERLDITGLTGITRAQRTALLALGAIEQHGPGAEPNRGSFSDDAHLSAPVASRARQMH